MAAAPAAVERLRAVPAAPEAQPDPDSRLRAGLRFGLCALLLWLPLPFGSVQPWAVLVLQLGAVALAVLALLLAARESRSASRLSLAALAIAVGLILFGALQSLPFISRDTASPGAQARSDLAATGGESVPARVPWSLAAPDTVDATSRLIAYVLLGFAAAQAIRSASHVRQLAIVIVAGATFQAIYGSAEYLSGSDHIFAYAKQFYRDCATGTFINRNHFAGYLALSIPLSLAAFANLRAKQGSSVSRWSWTIAGAATVFALFMGILLSQSRAGFAAALAAVAVYLWLIAPSRRVVWGLTGVLALAVLFVLWRDVNVPGERLGGIDADVTAPAGRVSVWRDTWTIAGRHALLGYGFGTFEPAFAAFSSHDIGTRIYDHAHNDYLQLLLEGGMPGLLGALAMLALLQRTAMRSGPEGRALTAALAAVALHATIDFGLRIPALAGTTSALVGGVLAMHPGRRE